MTSGVIYYNRGGACIIRLMVSIQSLRKFYDGNITVFMEDYDSNRISSFIEKHNVSIIDLTSEKLDNNYVRKIIISKLSPYNKTVFIDADTLIVGDINELFLDIENYDLSVTKFSNWTSGGKKISRRIRGFSPYISDKMISRAISYGPAINTGVYCFMQNSKIFEEWLEIARIGQEHNLYIPDEIACQILLPKYNVRILDSKFNTSVRFGENEKDKNIIHYHGRKHCRKYPLAELWIKEFIELLENKKYINEVIDNIINDYHVDKFLKYQYGWDSHVDKCLKTIKKLSPYHKDDYGPNTSNTTIVTACDTRYVEYLKLTFPTWVKHKDILRFPIIVYINGFKKNDSRLDFLKKYKNIRLIPWDMPNIDSQREKMLSSFVFGPAQDVNTKYWLKIDADTYTNDNRPLFIEDMKNYSIVGHKWKYTKPANWISKLNDWSLNKRLNFEYKIDILKIKKNRYYHERTNSFVQLHSTEFTKQAADLAGDRLPVPSQDTYLWYVAMALNKKICRYDFKRKCGLYNKKTAEQIKSCIQKNYPNDIVKLNIGCGKKRYDSWINTDKKTLDITDINSWSNNNINDESIDRILAEHVFEHLTDTGRMQAILNFKRFLKKDGVVRLAVPDGYHPDENYIKNVDVGGTGKSAYDHKFLYNYKTLSELFISNGFSVDLLEYFDEKGQFHFKEWDVKDGFIKRSSRYDRRNKQNKLSYTSLIIDLKKCN